jgi:hypothetical protein
LGKGRKNVGAKTVLGLVQPGLFALVVAGEQLENSVIGLWCTN